MTTKGTDPDGTADPRRPSEANSTAEALAEQRREMDDLRGRDEIIRGLSEQECELEVECIAARAALKAHPLEKDPGVAVTIEPAAARDIALSRRRRRELRESSQTLRDRLDRLGEGRGSELARLTAGRAALETWLSAGEPRPPDRAGRIVRWSLMVITIAAVVAAVAIHVAFLILLVPTAGAMSFLMWSGQDTAWERVGARRQYGETRLGGIESWLEPSVRTRMGELVARMQSMRTEVTPDAPEDEILAEQARVEAAIADESARLEDAYGAAGIEPSAIDAGLDGWLEAIARAHVARSELDRITAKLKAARGEAGKVRDGVYRFLSSHGEPGANGRADPQSLDEGLDRIASRNSDESSL